MNDIDMQGDTLVTIVSYEKTFDGGGHTISNLVIKSLPENSNYRCGLFAKGNGELIKDLTLSHVTLVHTATNASILCMGALCAEPNGTVTISNCTVDIDTILMAPISSTLHCGGIVGKTSNNTTITSCDITLHGCDLSQEGRINWGGFIGSVSTNKTIRITSSHYNGLSKLTSGGYVYAGGAIGSQTNGSANFTDVSIEGAIRAYLESEASAHLGPYIGGSITPTPQNSTSTIQIYINNVLSSK